MIGIAQSHITAQTGDTTNHRDPMRKHADYTGMAVRVATGIQGSFYGEVGLARTRFQASAHGLAGTNVYGTITVFPAFRKSETMVAGFRVGAELYGSGMLLGLEVSPFWSRSTNDVLISPRIGIGIPELSLYYSYSLSTNRWAIDRLARHHAGLQVSLRFWTHDRMRGRRYWMNKRGTGPKP